MGGPVTPLRFSRGYPALGTPLVIGRFDGWLPVGIVDALEGGRYGRSSLVKVDLFL